MELPYPYQNLNIASETDTHWYTLCPFHNDHEPSFTINKTKPYYLHYRCWSCGENGTPVKFAKKMKLSPQKIDSSEAKKAPPKPAIDWDKVLADYMENLPNGSLKALSDKLGVSELTLLSFRVGWTGKAWVYPMFQGNKISGLQRRYPDGSKKTIKHSKHGWFVPDIVWDFSKPLFVTEGFSDSAVVNELGLQAIGRYNASVQKPLKGMEQFKTIIISDNDDVGQKGSYSLAKKLPNSKVKLVTTHKDIRAMYLAEGAKKILSFLGENKRGNF